MSRVIKILLPWMGLVIESNKHKPTMCLSLLLVNQRYAFFNLCHQPFYIMIFVFRVRKIYGNGSKTKCTINLIHSNYESCFRWLFIMLFVITEKGAYVGSLNGIWKEKCAYQITLMRLITRSSPAGI